MTATEQYRPCPVPARPAGARRRPDLLRAMLTTFIDALMSRRGRRGLRRRRTACASPDRTNVRNGYRHRDFDTRAGTLDVAIPKLRAGSYFPDWLLERRRRAEAALTTVVATCYLLGVSTRRMEKLVESLGHHPAVQVAGLRDGQGPRRAGRGVPDPAAGRRARTRSWPPTRWC